MYEHSRRERAFSTPSKMVPTAKFRGKIVKLTFLNVTKIIAISILETAHEIAYDDSNGVTLISVSPVPVLSDRVALGLVA